MILVTAGPSGTAITPGRDITVVAPLATGDLTGYVEAGYSTILIVDGVFDQSLAVTVTEIRECIGRGARVFGSTSMGALRAVEAAPVGMVGLGSIFQLVSRGEIVSDADLALSFTTEFRALTVPLVNLRYLCRHLAWATGAYDELSRFYEAGRSMHFSERTFESLEDAAAQHGGKVTDLVVSHLAPACRPLWDLKALDAAAAVSELRRGGISSVTTPNAPRASVPDHPDRLLNGTSL